jgi:hypothetical protein
MRPRWLWALPAVVALAVFLPALQLPLIGDDYMIIAFAKDIGWSDIVNPSANWYHFVPGALAGWKLTIAAFGYHPLIWHAISMALFCASAITSVAVLRALGRPSDEALMGGVFFATFFASYETIAFAGTGICYHSALLSYFGAVVLYRSFQRTQRRITYVLFILAAILAITTFDVAILILPTIVILEYVEGGPRSAIKYWQRFLLPTLIVGAYWFAGGQVAASALPQSPTPVAMLKKLLIDLAYLSSFNQTWFRELFFNSYAIRIGWTVVVVGGSALLLLRASRSIRALLVWAVLHMVPFALLTGHQPRYFLFSSVAAAGLWAAAVKWLVTRPTGRRGERRLQIALSAAMVFMIVTAGAAFARDRLRSWAEAGQITIELQRLVNRELAARSSMPDVLLVDFPAMHGAYHDVDWPPFLFLSMFQDGRYFRALGNGSVPDTVRLVRTRAHDRMHPTIASDSMDERQIARLAADTGLIVIRYDPVNGLRRVGPPTRGQSW